jgi:DNA modification methylase
VIWDGEEGCEHEWGNEIKKGEIWKKENLDCSFNTFQPTRKNSNAWEKVEHNIPFCKKCHAWRGQLGLEPQPELYVKHIVEIFREVKRVLKPEGTCWINIGDSYFGDSPVRKSAKEQFDPKCQTVLKRSAGGDRRSAVTIDDLKPKDLVGVPWLVAFALRNDGWYLRSEIIWSKLNPMPESVTDRPTKAHETIFLLAKNQKYYFDQEAVRETSKDPEDDLRRIFDRQHDGNKSTPDDQRQGLRVRSPAGWKTGPGSHGSIHEDGREKTVTYQRIMAGRNIRTVWNVSTQPYSEAHFATFPEKLVEPMVKAGCPQFVCKKCGKARERIQRVTGHQVTEAMKIAGCDKDGQYNGIEQKNYDFSKAQKPSQTKKRILESMSQIKEYAFTDCGCNAGFKPGIVLDPFCGSGTVLRVAERLQRKAIGIDLGYQELAEKRKKWNQVELII